MARRKTPDHVYMGNTDTGGYALICCHCGAIYVPALPISIDMFIKVSRQFGVEHASCLVLGSGRFDPDALLVRAGLRHLRNLENRSIGVTRQNTQ